MMETLEIRCPVSARTEAALRAIRESPVSEVLVGGRTPGRYESQEEFAGSVVAIEFGQSLVLAFEAVQIGPKAEAFRAICWSPISDAPTGMRALVSAASSSLQPPRTVPLGESRFQIAILSKRFELEIELCPERRMRTRALVDCGVLLIDVSGARLLIEHDEEIPQAVRVSTSRLAIADSLKLYARATVL